MGWIRQVRLPGGDWVAKDALQIESRDIGICDGCGRQSVGGKDLEAWARLGGTTQFLVCNDKCGGREADCLGLARAKWRAAHGI